MTFHIPIGSFYFPVESPVKVTLEPPSPSFPFFSISMICKNGAFGMSKPSLISLCFPTMEKGLAAFSAIPKNSITHFEITATKTSTFFEKLNRHELCFTFNSQWETECFKELAPCCFPENWRLLKNDFSLREIRLWGSKKSRQELLNEAVLGVAKLKGIVAIFPDTQPTSSKAKKNRNIVPPAYFVFEKGFLKDGRTFQEDCVEQRYIVSSKITPQEKELAHEFLTHLVSAMNIKNSGSHDLFQPSLELIEPLQKREVPFENEFELELFINKLYSAAPRNVPIENEPLVQQNQTTIKETIDAFFKKLEQINLQKKATIGHKFLDNLMKELNFEDAASKDLFSDYLTLIEPVLKEEVPFQKEADIELFTMKLSESFPKNFSPDQKSFIHSKKEKIVAILHHFLESFQEIDPILNAPKIASLMSS